jgi:two-component system NarL family response regulator
MPAPPVYVHVLHPEAIVNAGVTALLARCPHSRLADIAPGGHAGVDVVVTDYADAMRRLPQAMVSGERVMIISQREREWDVRAAMAAGVHAYLPQRCDAAELEAALQTLGQGQRYFNKELLACATQNLAAVGLTSRESDVLELLAMGHCNKRIAITLDIGVGTVKSHVKSLFGKLGARARTHAVVLAQHRGLVSFKHRMALESPVEQLAD